MGSSLSKKKVEEQSQNKPIKSKDSLRRVVAPPVRPNGQYQNPQMMRLAQESYASRYMGPPAPGPDGVIPPFPTPDTKHDIYNAEIMVNIDNGVMNIPLEYAEKALSDFVPHLIKLATDDLGELRAMCKWLTAQNLDEYEIGKDPQADSILYQLLLVRAKRKNLNHVLQLMCNVAGIKCELIQGSTRPRSYYYGGKPISSHVWCAAYVADAWRLVDLHLAVHYQPSGVHSDEQVPSQINNKETQTTPRTHVTIDKIDSLLDFFFITDPYVFIYFNIPDNPEWQLLAEQISIEMFQNLVALTPAFFIENVDTVSEAKGIVEAAEGKANLKVTLGENHTLRVIYQIRRLVGITSIHKSRDGELRNSCFLYNQDNDRIINISLREIGRFQIVLYVVPAGRPNVEKKEICHYVVDVKSPDFTAKTLQHNPRFEYGPGSDTKHYGIDAVSHEEATIPTTDGLVKIQFKCSKLDGISLQPELTSLEISKDELKHHMLRSLTHDGVFTCYIKIPQAGTYMYKLMVQDMNNGALVNVCSYLIVSSAAYCDGEGYPEGVSGYIGDVSFLTWPLLKPTSHPDAILNCDKRGEISIEMETAFSLDIQTQLELFNLDSPNEVLTDYAWFVYKDNKLELEVTFPEAGQYTLSLFTKPRENETVLKHSWIYIINVNKPNEEALPFPTIHGNWSQSCDLRQPLCGYIQEAKQTTFEVCVPGAKDVAILTDTWACHSLVRDDDGSDDDGYDEDDIWWTGKVRTGNPGSALNLAAMFGDDSDYTYLLEYQILSSRQFQKIRTHQRQALKRAKERLRVHARRKEIEKATSEIRQMKMQSKAMNESSVFNKEKDRLQAEEAIYRRQELEKWKHDRDNLTKNLIVDSRVGLNEDNTVTQQVIDLQEAKDSNINARRNIHKGIKAYLMREKLREGTKLRDYDMLKSALMIFADLGLEEKDQDLTKARKSMDTLQAKRDLLEAMARNDLIEIQEDIDSIHRRGLYGPLQATVQEAQRLILAISKVDRLKLPVLGMDKNTMGEIRSYSHPPEGIHKVMQAALLLLGDDEYTTYEWVNCQRMCSLVGRESLNRRILDMNIQTLHIEILARAEEILTGLDLKQVQHISAWAATFYVWVTGTVEEAQKIRSDGDRRTKVIPADVTRQREIFGRPQLNERELTSYSAKIDATSARQVKDWVP